VPVSAAGALDERNVVASASKPVPAKKEAGLNETKVETEEKREMDAWNSDKTRLEQQEELTTTLGCVLS
jgi:hypothetical protein